MHPVFLAAAIVTAAAVLVMDAVGRDFGIEQRTVRRTVVAFLVGLPLSPLVDQYLKSPLTVLARELVWPAQFGPPPLAFFLLVLWIAPLVEEAAKLLPLALPEIGSALKRPGVPIEFGMVSGLGFGVGEAWYLAFSIAGSPSGSRVQQPLAWPAYVLVTYLAERVVVCFAHGVMTSVAVASVAMTSGAMTSEAMASQATAGSARGARAGASGYLRAVALHVLVNIGPLLSQTGIGGPLAPGLAMLLAIAVLWSVFERLRSAELDRLASGRK